MATITVTKGLIGVEDISFMTGGATTGETFSRTTSTGGSQAVHKLSAKAIPIEDSNSLLTAANVEAALIELQRECRSTFTYNGDAVAYTIKCLSAAYVCKDKYCRWISELTTNAIAAPVVSTWYYLYLDYSGITSGTAITATELIWSTTAPAWNTTYRGWYNGDDRCIFAVLTDAGTNIYIFYHDGDFVTWDAYFAEASAIAPSNTFTDVNMASSMPAFSRRVTAQFLGGYVDGAATSINWRVDGSAGLGHRVLITDADVANVSCVATVRTDASQIVEVRWDAATTNTISIYTVGWYLPIGM